MSELSPDQQRQIVQQVYRHAAELMRNGYSRSEIVKNLESKGLQRNDAQVVYERLAAARDDALEKAHRNVALQRMGWGALIFVIGVVVTVGTYSAVAKTGGSYTVAYGAILVGGFRFLQGLYNYVS